MFPKWILQNKLLIGFVMIFIFCLSLYAQYYFQIEVEGFDTIPIQYKDSSQTKLIDGYYQVDDKQMAAIPNGFIIDPNDPRNILPKTLQTKDSLIRGPKIFSNGQTIEKGLLSGQIIPDGYFMLNDVSLGTLPPNMMPNVKSVDVSYNRKLPEDMPKDMPAGALPPVMSPVLLVYYTPGYTSKAKYYENTFPTPSAVADRVKDNPHAPPYTATKPPPAAPPTMYFKDSEYTQVAFLPYGKIQDPSKGFGYVGDTNLISQTGKFDFTNTNFKDIANNYNVNYHESAEQLLEKAGPNEFNFSSITVSDQNGNPVKIPYNDIQGTVTYYRPGSFPFGGSTYIPKYEDSVYLSRLTQLSTTAPYTPSTGPMGACEKYADLPAQQEEYCRSLDANTCGSTSCCVLLGGSKCVSGNANGPTYKNNYGDYLLRNKDTYYYNGQCYGNCP